jgi:predicted nucleic acid-binding protein
MLVVSNTSPISNLAIVGRLNLLRSQFREIRVPIAVQSELDRVSDAAALKEIQRAFQDSWIKPQTLREGKIAQLLATTLDRGEAEAIALALELSADLILLDERDGRRAAEHAGLRVTGVLGVWLRAKNEGQIERIRPEFEASRTRARFFVSARLQDEVLEAAENRSDRLLLIAILTCEANLP